MMDMLKMMKQAATMRHELKRVQASLRKLTAEHTSGGVTVTARADGSIAKVVIDPSVVDPARAERLAEAVRAAGDGALDEARKMAAKEMSNLTGGLNIPGLT